MVLRRLTLLGFCLCLLVIQEYVLSYIPFLQFTTLLILVFSKNFNFKEMFVLVISYVILDNLLIGSFRLEYLITMLVAWLSYVFILKVLFKRVESELKLAIWGIIFAFIYSWLFVIVSVLIQEVSLLEYFILDIPFEIMLALANFVTIYWLYQPVNSFFKKHLDKNK